MTYNEFKKTIYSAWGKKDIYVSQNGGYYSAAYMPQCPAIDPRDKVIVYNHITSNTIYSERNSKGYLTTVKTGNIKSILNKELVS